MTQEQITLQSNSIEARTAAGEIYNFVAATVKRAALELKEESKEFEIDLPETKFLT